MAKTQVDAEAERGRASPEPKTIGVGIIFAEGIPGLKVEGFVPGSGADVCGELQPGDELLTVDGVDVTGKKPADLAPLFAGPVGSTAIITVWRSGQEDSGDGEAVCVDDVKMVEIPRMDFSVEDGQFVAWMDLADEDGPAAKGGKKDNKFKAGLKSGADRLFGAFSPIQTSVMKQVKNISQSVQQNAIFEDIQNRATMVRQAATSAALPLVKNISRDSSPLRDPRPRDWCMHMYTCPDKYVIFPPTSPPPPAGSPPPSAIVIDRKAIQVSCVSLQDAEILVRGRAKFEIMGVLGIAALQLAKYLVVVTGRSLIADVPGAGALYKVTSTEQRILGDRKGLGGENPIQMSNRAIEERLLSDQLETYSLYFSHQWDVTHTQQRLGQRPGGVQGMDYAGREDRFVWNHQLLQPFAAAHATRCVLPVVCGFAKVTELAGLKRQASLLLIGRRDWRRSGYRYLSRGIDAGGNVSNAVETEQVVMLPDADADAPSPAPAAAAEAPLIDLSSPKAAAQPSGVAAPPLSSFVIIRGSIPLFWSEADALVAFKPRPELGDADTHLVPLKMHMQALSEAYGTVVLLSLIESKDASHEKPISLALDKALGTTLASMSDFSHRFIPFDFHAVCGKLAFHNLPQLVKECIEDLERLGLYAPALNGSSALTQTGVFRVNCVDCLDRTNVAQSVLAFRALLWQLRALGLMTAEEAAACSTAVDAEQPLPYAWAKQLDTQFKSLWADHGDAISLQYSGSAALKGDLTRTGKRTVGGLFQDGVSSIKRCVQNNFADVHRQRVMESFHGVELTPEPTTDAAAAAGGGGGGGGGASASGAAAAAAAAGGGGVLLGATTSTPAATQAPMAPASPAAPQNLIDL